MIRHMISHCNRDDTTIYVMMNSISQQSQNFNTIHCEKTNDHEKNHSYLLMGDMKPNTWEKKVTELRRLKEAEAYLRKTN